jgi:hypothetical protein
MLATNECPDDQDDVINDILKNAGTKNDELIPAMVHKSP